METPSIFNQFLKLFLSFYKVDEIKILKFENNQIFEEIIWYDAEENDDKVFFQWDIHLDQYQILHLIEVMDYILTHNLYYSDNIQVSEEELIIIFKNKGWREIEIKTTVENLFNIEIVRYENNEKVGAFFVHL